MDAVTYPNAKVIEFINKNLVPVKLGHDAQPFAKDYNVTWTPNLLILDAAGKDHHRAVGFMPPDELIPFLMLGLAKLQFDQGNYAESIPLLENVVAEYPQSAAAPESVFQLGVSRYKATKETKFLKEAHKTLKAKYPGSEWIKRSEPYSLLP